MFPFSRKKKQPKPTPTWMTWMMVGFLAYVLVINNTGSNKAKTGEKTGEISEEKTISEPFIDTKKIINTEVLEGKFFPQAVRKLSWQDTKEGTGEFAICGQKATINYRSLPVNPKSNTTYIDDLNNVAFTIGEGTQNTALEKGLIAMKKGGTRTIFAATDENGNDEKFEIELVDISPAIPPVIGYRILGDTQERSDSFACGAKVKLNVKIADTEGKKLFASGDKPIEFTIGKSEVFLGLEQGALGMTPHSKRTIIIPASFQKTMNGNKPIIDFALPKNQTVIVDIETVTE